MTANYIEERRIHLPLVMLSLIFFNPFHSITGCQTLPE
jgi:hypothetical protein